MEKGTENFEDVADAEQHEGWRDQAGVKDITDVCHTGDNHQHHQHCQHLDAGADNQVQAAYQWIVMLDGQQ